MIRQQTVETGIIVKTHGVNGELVIETTAPDFFDDNKGPIFLELEGLLVPFFIDKSHVLSHQRVRLKFDSITSENKAKTLVGSKVFIPVPADEDNDEQIIPSPDAVKSFEVIDKKYGTLGKVADVVNLATNPVMIVTDTKNEILIPFHPQFIKKINFNKKQISVITPEGLLGLYR